MLLLESLICILTRQVILKNRFLLVLIIISIPFTLLAKEQLKIGKMTYKYSEDDSNPKASYYSVNYPIFENINEGLKEQIYFDLEITNKIEILYYVTLNENEMK